MHEKVLTRAEPPQTLLERLDARVKILCVLVWAVSVVTVPAQQMGLLGVYAAILFAALTLSYRNLGKFLRRFATALPFILVLVVLLPFFKEGQVLWHIGPIEVTHEGLMSAERVAASALVCVAAICLVWATTSEADLIGGLRGVGLPAIFVGVIAFMLRYLHVLRPELHRLWDARAARTIGRRNGAAVRSAANLLGAFFLRSHERAERVADAMAARGYDGEWRGVASGPLKLLDGAAGGVVVAGIILLRWIPWS